MASATIRNARVLGLDKKLDSVAVGKIANLVVLNDNPLKTVEAYNNIDQVILQGKVYGREAFVVN
ncbi:amidohydrolase family protein [Endozoicomonas sp. SM1973]|uniref:Amidohydrolase family protein n=1 Tax=Spartinivicinus marinus TaxID=2994442 RepID=A0A853I5U2_9GAMM|nr:amidohydrolase family protein [Spartinivicinus marinus]